MLVKIKAIVAILLLIFGIITAVTGIGLINAPRGRVARDLTRLFLE